MDLIKTLTRAWVADCVEVQQHQSIHSSDPTTSQTRRPRERRLLRFCLSQIYSHRRNNKQTLPFFIFSFWFIINKWKKMTFDATDKKYQISKDFPPNKESTWAYPKEKDGTCFVSTSFYDRICVFGSPCNVFSLTSFLRTLYRRSFSFIHSFFLFEWHTGWVHAHNSIRYEMKELNAAFRAIQSRGQPLTEWEIQCIKSVWESHEIHVHAHHSNEDDHFVPFLKTRFVYPEQVGDFDIFVCRLLPLRKPYQPSWSKTLCSHAAYLIRFFFPLNPLALPGGNGSHRSCQQNGQA